MTTYAGATLLDVANVNYLLQEGTRRVQTFVDEYLANGGKAKFPKKPVALRGYHLSGRFSFVITRVCMG